MKKLTIVYIAGSGRSGSTLLDRAVGSAPGATSLNEAHRIFEHGCAQDIMCSCGEQFSGCAFWGRVMARCVDDEQVASAIDWSRRYDRSRLFPSMYFGLLGKRRKQELHSYRELLHRFFGTIADDTDADVLVDSSKIPTRALVMAGIPDFDVRVIHLLRDPRAVAHAWARYKHDPGRERAMTRYPLGRTMTFWAARQLFTSTLARRMPVLPVRYEDFVADPRGTLERIRDFVPALAGRPLPVEGERTVLLKPIHTLSGNPDRFTGGATEIVADERWRESPMAPSLERTYRLIRPIARRYGYE